MIAPATPSIPAYNAVAAAISPRDRSNAPASSARVFAISAMLTRKAQNASAPAHVRLTGMALYGTIWLAVVLFVAG